MDKRNMVFSIVLMYLLLCFPSSVRVNANCNASRSYLDVNKPQVTKEEVIQLIKSQGKEENYYLQDLSYQLINVDYDDDDLEIVVCTYGGVHLGYFFVFDKGADGKYYLAAERPWKVDKLSFQDFPQLSGGIKLHELVDHSGGTGISVLTAHLWYLKKGKFVEAWQGILKERAVFQENYGLTVGSYQYTDTFENLYTWSSDYLIDMKTNKQKTKPTTTVAIYKFDGSKFILETQEKFKHSKVFPNIKF